MSSLKQKTNSSADEYRKRLTSTKQNRRKRNDKNNSNSTVDVNDFIISETLAKIKQGQKDRKQQQRRAKTPTPISSARMTTEDIAVLENNRSRSAPRAPLAAERFQSQYYRPRENGNTVFCFKPGENYNNNSSSFSSKGSSSRIRRRPGDNNNDIKTPSSDAQQRRQQSSTSRTVSFSDDIINNELGTSDELGIRYDRNSGVAVRYGSREQERTTLQRRNNNNNNNNNNNGSSLRHRSPRIDKSKNSSTGTSSSEEDTRRRKTAKQYAAEIYASQLSPDSSRRHNRKSKNEKEINSRYKNQALSNKDYSVQESVTSVELDTSQNNNNISQRMTECLILASDIYKANCSDPRAVEKVEKKRKHLQRKFDSMLDEPSMLTMESFLVDGSETDVDRSQIIESLCEELDKQDFSPYEYFMAATNQNINYNNNDNNENNVSFVNQHHRHKGANEIIDDAMNDSGFVLSGNNSILESEAQNQGRLARNMMYDDEGQKMTDSKSSPTSVMNQDNSYETYHHVDQPMQNDLTIPDTEKISTPPETRYYERSPIPIEARAFQAYSRNPELEQNDQTILSDEQTTTSPDPEKQKERQDLPFDESPDRSVARWRRTFQLNSDYRDVRLDLLQRYEQKVNEAMMQSELHKEHQAKQDELVRDLQQQLEEKKKQDERVQYLQKQLEDAAAALEMTKKALVLSRTETARRSEAMEKNSSKLFEERMQMEEKLRKEIEANEHIQNQMTELRRQVARLMVALRREEMKKERDGFSKPPLSGANPQAPRSSTPLEPHSDDDSGRSHSVTENPDQKDMNSATPAIVEKLSSEILSLRSDLVQVKSELADARAAIQSAHEDILKLTRERDNACEKASNLANELNSLKDEAEMIKARANRLDDDDKLEISRLNAEIARLKSALKKSNEAEAQNTTRTQKLKEELSEIQSDAMRFREKAIELERRLVETRSKADERQRLGDAESERLQNELKDLKEKLSKTNSEIIRQAADHRKEQQRLQEELEHSQEVTHVLQLKIANMDSDIAQAESEAMLLQESAAGSNSRHENLLKSTSNIMDMIRKKLDSA